MVRASLQDSPLPYCALSSVLCVLILGQVHSVSILLRIVFASVLVISSACPCILAATHRRRRARPPRFFIVAYALAAGITLGASARVGESLERSYYASSLASSRIRDITCILRTDPLPLGPEVYACDSTVTEAADSSGIRSEAHFRARLIIPRQSVQSLGPEGLSRNTTPVFFSKGLAVSLLGTIDTNEDGFLIRASSVALPKLQRAEVPFPTTRRRPWDTFFSEGSRFRARIRLSLSRRLHSWGKSGGLLLALFSGNRDYLDPSLALEFRNAGLSHVLALSGMHLSLVASLSVFLGKVLLGKRLGQWATSVTLIAFVWFAGESPSLTRAFYMFFASAVFSRLGYSRSIIPALAISACAQCLVDPSGVSSPAFLLSYSALVGLATLTEDLSELTRSLAPSAIIGPLASTVGAWTAASLMSAFIIGTLAPIGLVSSLVASPLASLYLVTGIPAALISSCVPALDGLCRAVVTAQYSLLEGSVRWFSGFPVVTLRDLSASLVAGILCLAAIAFARIARCHYARRRSPDAGFARLRFANRPQAIPGFPGHGHAEKIRAEFPDKRLGSVKARLRA